MEILIETLTEMPVTFSSNLFSTVAQKKGLTKQEVANGVIGMFLHKNCIQSKLTRRMWHKKDLKSNDLTDMDVLNEAIKLVKSAGLKVMKPINEWIEI